MPGNNISLKSVVDLSPYQFFIPFYQRGYRWTPQEVKDLLNDIHEFTPEQIAGSDKKTWYCLQPVIVKRREDKWDVVDGQQRLTTIFLIWHYLNKDLGPGRRKNLFELQYETRQGSGDYLKNQLGQLAKDDSNIDYFFISMAYQVVSAWFGEKDASFNWSDFESKFYHSTKVIWYEVVAEDAIDIFTRINMGKIGLTNAELIKALFLNSSNFNGADEEQIRLRQLEIASDWDQIERTLWDESFWHFLNNTPNPLETHIEFIFDLIADKCSDEDEYSTFRFFQKKFKNKSTDEVLGNWSDVKRCFQTLQEWYEDRDLYHKIGFLIYTGVTIDHLISLFRQKKTKTAFNDCILDLIKEQVNVQIIELKYDKHRPTIKRLLLLHNIQTMLYRDSISRFPFDRFKIERWDIEHIIASAEEMPEREDHQREWLKETAEYIGDGALKERSLAYNREEFPALYADILVDLREKEDIDDLSNLALLDASTNRGYGNAVFYVKRSVIIEKDSNGAFIPICTKNIFLKYYTTAISQMYYWDEQNRKDYLKDIEETLSEYLPAQAPVNHD